VTENASADSPVSEPWITKLMAELYPLCRSITGNGTRATLDILARECNLTRHEVSTGTAVLDWRIPDEWNLHRAVLSGPQGIIADTASSNLHIMGYSEPRQGDFELRALSGRLHSLPGQPSVIPYRTSYYTRTWGFCLAHDTLSALQPGKYTVEIDATLAPGALSYGELFVPGRRREEVLVSTHICHPAMANDNLTGIVASLALARWAAAQTRELSYRFLFVPATIGAIAWLAANRDNVGWIRHGLVLTGLGDAAPLTYKRSRRGNAPIDRLMSHLLRESGRTLDWSPYGYDERQFCSPGFDLPVGRLSRAPHGTYPEYHTSADDLSFVDPTQVTAAIDLVLAAFDAVEVGLVPRSLAPYGEPQLGRRGLFRSTGGALGAGTREYALLWLLSLADGEHDLVAVAERSGLPLADLLASARLLRGAGLLA
jgi:aminopeptidase-like protein